MIIRNATREDMPQVLALIQELAVFEHQPDAVEITAEDLARDCSGDNPLFHCLVAENAREIVGIALFYYRYSTWKGRILHLEDLVVKEAYRGQGTGKALYREVMQFAYEQGCKRVVWDVLDWNEDAIEFYERSGATLMKEWRVVHMDEAALHRFVESSPELLR